MPEDYLVKSGAKDMLATAIAEVLTLRPRVPMAFLAAHFQVRHSPLQLRRFSMTWQLLKPLPHYRPAAAATVYRHDRVLQ
ncbi:hypothetical protein PF008_g25218 [Phytophthora fragariae]|uniref:Uncharacterized protein n=1 Tax=Phytophthora fragariae TaxID=53985 RepID=A0A6G0QLE4_9STRA|nr:hypothetical protein PF008_g25218 [Phytophthora fragariae]